jgi:hypothetical protein
MDVDETADPITQLREQLLLAEDEFRRMGFEVFASIEVEIPSSRPEIEYYTFGFGKIGNDRMLWVCRPHADERFAIRQLTDAEMVLIAPHLWKLMEALVRTNRAAQNQILRALESVRDFLASKGR